MTNLERLKIELRRLMSIEAINSWGEDNRQKGVTLIWVRLNHGDSVSALPTQWAKHWDQDKANGILHPHTGGIVISTITMRFNLSHCGWFKTAYSATFDQKGKLN